MLSPWLLPSSRVYFISESKLYLVFLGYRMDNLIYLAILVILSIISSAWKKKNQEKENAPNDADLEEEIRRMAERFMGKREEPRNTPPVETYQPAKPTTPSYESFDEYAGDERYSRYEEKYTQRRIDYSEEDIKQVEERHESYKRPEYALPFDNYDQKSIESMQKGKELHSLMHDDDAKTKAGDKLEKHTLFEDFDPRKAIIYAEILKRPEY